jgi:hypothetical protein
MQVSDNLEQYISSIQSLAERLGKSERKNALFRARFTCPSEGNYIMSMSLLSGFLKLLIYPVAALGRPGLSSIFV